MKRAAGQRACYPGAVRWTVIATSVLGLVAARPAAAEPDATPWLGISFTGAMGQPLEVTAVYPGTGAARAGITVGDVIVAIDDAPLMSDDDLRYRVRNHALGERARVDVAREGRVLRLSARLGAMPPAGELLELRLRGSPLPAMELVDRHDDLPVGLDGRPAILVVFDAQCEPCGGAASALVGAAADSGATVAVRTVILGVADEVRTYLARVPVTGVVARWQPAAGDSMRGGSVLSGLNPRAEGAILVVDHAGVVQFAASTADLELVQTGALAAAARAQQRWRRLR